ncbi:MAG: CDP-alcohol phosphatidyltransferase family protein [Deltaproteobacteria bacterium]|nr:CDP-alcohol phosphatidyltransferase family protein [Deltaproteobacteria bacterium]
MLNLPNLFSLARIVLLFPFIHLLLNGRYGYALAVGFAAGLTDLLDGALARRLRQQTVLGTFLDPAADKLFMTASFITLASAGLLPVWLALLVIGRDVMIVLGVILLRLLSFPLEARPSMASKVTTALQLLTIGAPILALSLYPIPWLAEILIVACAAGTIISGAQYIGRGVQTLRKGKS